MLGMISSYTVDNYFLLTALAAIFTLVLVGIPLYVCDSSATPFPFQSFYELNPAVTPQSSTSFMRVLVPCIPNTNIHFTDYNCYWL